MNFDEFKDYPDTTTPLNATFLNGLLNLLMPIGKTEIFYDNEDHSNYMGFTWERTAIGKVPVGINTSDTDFNTIGKTGGEKSHILTQSELPNYNLKGLRWSNSGGPITLDSGSYTPGYNLSYGYSGINQGQINNIIINSGGSNTPHNNLQPYEVMAFWKRVE